MILDIAICIIVFFVGFHLKNLFSDFSRFDRKVLNQLFLVHFVIAIAFHFYIATFGGDAQYYWSEPKNSTLDDIFAIIERGSATGSIYLINYIPSKLLQLSFFTGNMLYALLGYLGFIYLYRTVKFVLPNSEKLKRLKIFSIPIFPWIFFLPNLHFWSSGIGKDTILFFCIMAFTYGLHHIKKRFLLLALAIVLSLAIRPHITLFLLIAFGIAFLLDGRLKVYQKAMLSVFFVAGFVMLFEYVLRFVQLESFETGAIEQYASTKASKLNQATSGSGIDISGYPFPLKVFTFLYRPFFIDGTGLLALIASVENLIILLFTLKILFNKPWRAFREAKSSVKGMFFFFLMGTVSFSIILGNLGIMLRQKNMFIPFFIVFGMWTLYNNIQLKTIAIESPSSHK